MKRRHSFLGFACRLWGNEGLAFFLAFLLFCLLPCSFVSSARAAEGDAILSGGPDIRSAAGIVIDVHSGAVLYAKNTTTPMAPVSLTKLMTCLLAYETLSLTDTVTCSYSAIHDLPSNVTRVGLREDERITAAGLLSCVLVASADEAAYALGEAVAGNRDAFVARMNERAAALGCLDTVFTTPFGGTDAEQHSCAYDLAKIAAQLGRHHAFLDAASVRYYILPETNKAEARTMAQTHKFMRGTLTYEAAVAGKTGGQAADGTYSLCTYASRGGMLLAAIVLGSPSDSAAYEDTTAILEYAFANYISYPMLRAQSGSGAALAGLFSIHPMFSRDTDALVSVDENASLVLPLDADLSLIEKSVSYRNIAEYVHGANVIGEVRYTYLGQTVGAADIIFNNPAYPLSQEEFDRLWPLFLIPPATLIGELPSPTPGSTTGEGTETTLTPTPTEPETSKSAGFSPAATRSLLLFGGTFFVSLIVIYIAVPMSQNKKARRNRRRRSG